MDMNAIRARLAGLSNKTKKRNDIWKPKDKHTIRCLPYPHGDEPFLELGFHYEIGNTRSVLCPKHNFGEQCDICDFAEKLRSWTDENGNDKPEALRKQDFELFKKIQVKERWYVPVIDRDALEEGPKFYAFGKTIFENLLNMCLNEELAELAGTEGTGILTNLDNAFDLTIDFKQPNNKDGKGNDKNWPVTLVGHRMKATPLASSKKEAKAIVDAILNIHDVYQKVSSDEVSKIFRNFVNEGAQEVQVEDSGVEYKSNTAEKPVEGGQSIDEAFDNL